MALRKERSDGDKRMKKMKKGVKVINCARGELVDEGALVSALKEGHVSAAALDEVELLLSLRLPGLVMLGDDPVARLATGPTC